MAMDRAYIGYEKLQQRTEREVKYVSKMKKPLRYTALGDTMYQTPDGLAGVRIQDSSSSNRRKAGRQYIIRHV